MKPVFFAAQEDFRAWLEEHHAAATEIVVGYYKIGSGRPSMTWPESVDQALCFGWIDGVRRSHDEISYTVRFTPRKKGSRWSAVNVAKVAELTAQGLMMPAGIAVFEARGESESEGYRYSDFAAELSPELEALFRANAAAWEFFEAQPPGYRRIVIYRVMSAKQEKTRLARLEKLIDASENRRRL